MSEYESNTGAVRITAPSYETHQVGQTGKSFDYFYEIISLLMGPNGCPWDREQSPESMRQHILEEAYELIEAIDNKDESHMDEEIGDLYLVVSMVMRMREVYGDGSSELTLLSLAEKLVRRHPHVFSNANAHDAKSVKVQWDAIKRDVEGKLPADSLDEEHKGFPPIARAYKLQKKAAKRGFDWPDAVPVVDKVHEELEEIKTELDAVDISGPPSPALEEEVGDLLFSAVNLARKLKIDPSIALSRSTRKFAGRFDRVKKQAEAQGLVMEETPLEELDKLWDKAKIDEDKE